RAVSWRSTWSSASGSIGARSTSPRPRHPRSRRNPAGTGDGGLRGVAVWRRCSSGSRILARPTFSSGWASRSDRWTVGETELLRRPPGLPREKLLVLVDELHGRVSELEQAQHEPLAIVGMSCRFPGGVDGPEAFWTFLSEGSDAVWELRTGSRAGPLSR